MGLSPSHLANAMTNIKPDCGCESAASGGLSRRELLTRSGMGLAALALMPLLPEGISNVAAGEAGSLNPLAPKRPHFPARAKRVIHLFMNGGPSQVDTFDPKPALEKYAGKELPTGNLQTERKTGAAFPSPFKFKKYGQSGIEVSELFPHVGEHVDDIAVIRSMVADIPNHEPSLLLMNCGEARLPRPSMGSWLTYGLGSENQNLPGFVAMCPGGLPIQGAQNWQIGVSAGHPPGDVHRHAACRNRKADRACQKPSHDRRSAAAAARPAGGFQSRALGTVGARLAA